MSARSLLKDCTPPLLWRWLRRMRGRDIRFACFEGDWTAASRASSGYDAGLILAHAQKAARAVVAGHATFDRDGVAFTEPAYPFPLLAGLMRSAALNAGHLDVVDFGGALGSTYRQCRPFLGALAGLRWNVVEQPHVAMAGRQEFSGPELSFFDRAAELPAATAPRVFLTSAVPQYLPRPMDAFDAALACGAKHLIVDRLSLIEGDEDRLCLQYTPAHIYPASYPCWLLSRTRWLAALAPHWQMLCEFDSEEGQRRTEDGVWFRFQGFIFERRT